MATRPRHAHGDAGHAAVEQRARHGVALHIQPGKGDVVGAGVLLGGGGVVVAGVQGDLRPLHRGAGCGNGLRLLHRGHGGIRGGAALVGVGGLAVAGLPGLLGGLYHGLLTGGPTGFTLPAPGVLRGGGLALRGPFRGAGLLGGRGLAVRRITLRGLLRRGGAGRGRGLLGRGAGGLLAAGGRGGLPGSRMGRGSVTEPVPSPGISV